MTDHIKEHTTFVGDICILVPPSGESILFDAADYDLVKGFKWRAIRNSRTCVYANALYKTKENRLTGVLMHRLIMGSPAGMFVDHANGSGLDNRRSNLAIVTPQQNALNRKSQEKSCSVEAVKDTRTGFIGVSRADVVKGLPYRAYINTGGRSNARQHHLGYYATPKEAALVRDSVAKHFFASGCKLNFPNEKTDPRPPSYYSRLNKKKSDTKYSEYFGVSKSAIGRWVAKIGLPESEYQQSVRHLGTYDTEEDAARAYDAAARFLNVTKERWNFPNEEIAPVDPLKIYGVRKRKSGQGYYGIYKKRRYFVARIMVAGVQYQYRKSFITAEQAARCHDGMARFLNETHFLNFPEENIDPIDINDTKSIRQDRPKRFPVNKPIASIV